MPDDEETPANVPPPTPAFSPSAMGEALDGLASAKALVTALLASDTEAAYMMASAGIDEPDADQLLVTLALGTLFAGTIKRMASHADIDSAKFWREQILPHSTRFPT